jgi:hypothetical protein
MKLQLIAGVAVIGLALTAGTAFAQHVGGPTSPQDQQKLMNMPGYSLGTGSATIGGPTSPQDQKKLMNSPGYHVGTGSAPAKSKQ